jgi:predicted DNA-binding transcriptional regulator YafY
VVRDETCSRTTCVSDQALFRSSVALRVTLPVEQTDYAAEQLLGLAAYVEVLELPELRERLRQLARRIARLNAA